jgi:hypothetical protein
LRVREGIDLVALEKILASSGVKISPQDVDAVARSLARINHAAAGLFPSCVLDETAERFFRLLESDADDGTGP